jgi:serine/threonine protein phosphatase PrpC
MGRGTRSETATTVALRGAATVYPDVVDELEPLPSQYELRAADHYAPRDGFASQAAQAHPEWNEDRALCDHAAGLALLFDGMGGHKGGERASTTACGSVARRLERLPEFADVEGRRAWLLEVLEHAKENVREDMLLHPAFSQQGTTFAAAVLAGEPGDLRVLLANAGDSRVYHVDGHWVTPFTKDDDLFAGQPQGPAIVAARALLDSATTAEELERLPFAKLLFAKRHVVTRSLMVADDITVHEQHVSPGERLIVCSDGVSDNLALPELEALIAAYEQSSDEDLAAALCQAARERADDATHKRAKDDDITAVVLTVG